MKQTRHVINLLRIAAQTAAFLCIAFIVMVFVFEQNVACTLTTEMWPYAAVIIGLYALLTIGEDYLNKRAIMPRF